MKASDQPPHAKKQTIGLFSILLLIMVLASLAVSAWLWFERQQADIALNAQFARFEQTSANNANTVQQLQALLEQRNKQTISEDAVLQQSLNDLTEASDKMLARLSLLEANSSQDWLLPEVEFLLRMADHRLLMRDDVSGAIALLTSALAVIQKIPVEDAGLHDVRVAIRSDLNRLKAFQAFDVAAVYAQLKALATMLVDLPMVPLESRQPASNQREPENSSFWYKVQFILDDYFSVRQFDGEDTDALLNIEQLNFRQEMTQLALARAESALLLANQAIFLDSIAKIQQILQQYYDRNSPEVQLAQETLAEIAALKLVEDIPTIQASQLALKDYLTTRLKTR